MLINYIPIKQSIGRFLKECGLPDTAYLEDFPIWIEDAIDIIGIPNYYTYGYALSEVVNHKAVLPTDIKYLHSVWVTPVKSLAESTSDLKRLFIRNSPLFGHGVKENVDVHSYGSIIGTDIETSFEKGYLYIIYKKVPLDCDGFPMSIKDAKLTEALNYWFIYKMGLSGFKHPVIAFDVAYQMWNKLYPMAGNSINQMDLQDLQAFTELWTNPIIGDLHNKYYIY